MAKINVERYSSGKLWENVKFKASFRANNHGELSYLESRLMMLPPKKRNKIIRMLESNPEKGISMLVGED
jgi:hypothetical protein